MKMRMEKKDVDGGLGGRLGWRRRRKMKKKDEDGG